MPTPSSAGSARRTARGWITPSTSGSAAGSTPRAVSPRGGGTFTFDAEYQDIVPDERIVYTYAMTLDGRRVSASVATIVFAPTGTGTHLRLTEQGVFLDGLDASAARERGTHELVDALAASLAAQPAGASR